MTKATNMAKVNNKIKDQITKITKMAKNGQNDQKVQND